MLLLTLLLFTVLADCTAADCTAADCTGADSAASYADVKNGMPCGTMLQLTTSTGISFTFNDTSRTVAGYGQDVCTHLMGLKAVCWPGPANAPVTGDGAPRVCANMEQERKNFFFFLF